MSDRELVPAGYYDAVAIATPNEDGSSSYARLAFAKNDTRQVCALFEITSGPHVGERLVWFGFFTKDAGKRTVESLRIMGLKGNDLGALETTPLDQRVSIKVGHDEWEGKVRARVDFVNAPGGGMVKLNKPMSKDEIRKFAAMMRDSLAKVPEREGARVEPPAKASAPPATPSADERGDAWEPDHAPASDDSIPF